MKKTYITPQAKAIAVCTKHTLLADSDPNPDNTDLVISDEVEDEGIAD